MPYGEKSTANAMLNGEKLKVFPQDQKQDKHAHSYHLYSSTGVLAREIRARKRYKRHPNQKKEVKWLFADGMILCIENYLYGKIHKEAVGTNKCIQ